MSRTSIDAHTVDCVSEEYSCNMREAVERFNSEWPNYTIDFVNGKRFHGQCRVCGKIVRGEMSFFADDKARVYCVGCVKVKS